MRNFTFKSALLKRVTALFGILFLATSQINAQYCTSTNTSSSTYYITNVSTTGGSTNISNIGTGFSASGYGDYTSQYVTVIQGNTFSLSSTAGPSGYTYVWAVYCDWNYDNDFSDPGETVYTMGSYVTGITTNITVPSSTAVGNVRMRIRASYYTPVPAACGSNAYGEAEDYVIKVQALVPCASATFPSSATTTATPSTICVSGNITLSMTPASAMPPASGVTFKWQTSPTLAGTYTDIPGSTSANSTYTTTTPISASAYFRCVVLCNGTSTVLTSTPTQVVVTNPGTVTTTPASRCGPGSVTLSATPSISTNTIAWYANAVGGLALATGNNFTTPSLPVTTTYYVDAETQGAPLTATIGTGTIQNQTYEYPTPYGQYYGSAHDQYLIKASELYAAGMSAGNITSIAFELGQGYSSATLQSYQIMMANTNVNALTLGSLITTGFTPVIPAMAYTPPATTGFATIPFSTPFVWDGVSNVVVDVSFSNCSVCNGTSNCTTSYTNNGVVKQTSTSFASSQSYRYDGNCTINTMAIQNYYLDDVFNQRPNIRFATQPVCASPRQAIVATISPSPAVSIAKPAVVCANEIGNIVVTSAPMSNYTTYAWTPNIADLYTNVGATTPYAGGSAPNAYFKSTVNGAHTYYLFSSGATPAACTHADTFSIWVQPDSISIKGNPDSICVSGTSILSLLPATGYAPNSVQWQESTNGITYNNITGATGTSYTTPTLTTNHYYKALVKSTNDTCEMPVKYVVVVNPILLGATDSFNCGPGTVTLQAQTGGNSTAKWYDVQTGGVAIGYGSPWITPSLNASQTYYVSAEGGSGGSENTYQVGTGTSTSSTTVAGPFNIYYGRSTMQFLYTAAEVVAAGGGAGNLTSLAFNCTGIPLYNILNYTVSIKFVPSTMTTLTWQASGLNQVYNNASFHPSATGWQSFPFSLPQVWNGTDNIVVQLCWNQTNPQYNASGTHQYTTKSGRFLYAWADGTLGSTSCGLTGSSTSTNLPNIRFNIVKPCQTPRLAVHANIYPKPAVDLGPDVNMCVDAGAALVLDAGVQPNTPTFLWDDNSTSQVRAVNSSGTYNVKVTNSYTCVGSDTVNIVLRKNPAVHLGNDTTVCNGVTLTLNPGGGSIEYFWNTGQTGQTIDVNSAGSYSVFVTNAEGCTSTDTIQVMMQGELPTIGGIQVSNDGVNRFHFTAVYPQNVIGYDWDFGDGSLHSYEASPTHQYDSVGDYIVVLHLSSTCGFASDTVGAHIVGIHQLNVSTNELTVYPNPSSGQATILNKGDLKMEKIEIYSVLGQVVYRSKADSKDKHVINLSGIASGMYTIEVYTDKGTVARKLEIIK